MWNLLAWLFWHVINVPFLEISCWIIFRRIDIYLTKETFLSCEKYWIGLWFFFHYSAYLWGERIVNFVWRSERDQIFLQHYTIYYFLVGWVWLFRPLAPAILPRKPCCWQGEIPHFGPIVWYILCGLLKKPQLLFAQCTNTTFYGWLESLATFQCKNQGLYQFLFLLIGIILL